MQKCDVWLAIGSGHFSSAGSLVAGGRVRPDVSFDTP